MTDGSAFEKWFSLRPAFGRAAIPRSINFRADLVEFLGEPMRQIVMGRYPEITVEYGLMGPFGGLKHSELIGVSLTEDETRAIMDIAEAASQRAVMAHGRSIPL